MTVYRNPSRQAAARTGNQETPPAIQDIPNRKQAQTQNSKAVNILPPQAMTSVAEYGFAFQSGPERVSVQAPGEIAAVPLSDHAVLSAGVKHEAGLPELLVHNAGDYLIDLILYLTSEHEKQATFAIQANGVNIPGGAWDVSLHVGYQAVTGFAMAHLNENSRIRIVMTSASPVEVKLAGSGTTAALSIRKL